MNIKKDEKLQSDYIIYFSILIVVTIINIALCILLTPKAIYGLFIIGILEFELAKRRSVYLGDKFALSFLIPMFLLIPGLVALVFNNYSVGLPLGSIGLLIVFTTKIYLMLVKSRRDDGNELRLPKLISVEVIILLLLNIYLINFYNYQNRVEWITNISSGISSTLKLEEDKIKLLTNDDFLMRNFYNFPQTYTLNKITGKVESVESGYKYPKEFLPFKGEVKNVKYGDLEVAVSKNRVKVSNFKTGKVIINFIAKGEIVSTPIIERGILYFSTNGKLYLDKVKRTNIYAIDISL